MKVFIIISALVVALNASVPRSLGTEWVNGELTPDNSTICKKCQGIVEEVREQLQNPDALDKIEKIVHARCSLYILKPIVEECEKVADKLIVELLDKITSDLDPQEVCSIAGFCKNPKIIEDLQTKLESLECPVCEAMVWAMEKLLEDPTVDHKIENVIEKTCKILPSSYEQKCRDLIEKYGPEIFDMINRHMGDKREICTKVGLC